MRRKRHSGYSIVTLVGFLVLFGLVMLASASSNLGKTRFDDPYYFLKHQIIYGLVIGVAGFFAASKINYKIYKKLSPFLILIGIFLLALVFTPLGVKAGGAERWLALGPITFQPSEVLKIPFVLYLAAWLSGNKKRSKSFRHGFMPFLIILSVISVLLLKQPATSVVAVLIGVALIVYFASGAKMSYIAGIILVFLIGLIFVIYTTPYRLNRIIGFLNPDANPLAERYHLNQALIAIGSGGLFGVGYGQSTTKINYLPEPIGDSIFAVIGEELGFAGSLFLISLFFLLVIKMLMVAKSVPDHFGKLVVIGFASLIGLQAFINIGSISGLLPPTGIPLPFISFGGTALAVFMTISGIVYNIAKNS